MKHEPLLKRKIKRISPFIAASLLLCSNPGIESWAAAGVEHAMHVEQSQKNVKGKVTDVDCEPLSGVNITLVGKSGGTISNIDGNFSIIVPNGV